MTGVLHCVGMGPGDPELLTVKAVRLLRTAPVVAYFSKRGRAGHARRIAGAHIAPQAEELRFEYPYTTEVDVADENYAAGMRAFYEAAAVTLADRLAAGLDVALLCEGDPFFYGSAMHVFDLLAGQFPAEVTPGVTGMSGCWSQARLPMTHGDDVLTVLPGTMGRDQLAARLAGGDASVIMKVGRNFPKIRAALGDAGLLARAVYVERGTMEGAAVRRCADVSGAAPYFSMVLVPGRRGAR